MWEKQSLSFFNISETLPEYQQKIYISGIFWAFKITLQIIHAPSYIALFLPDSNNSLFICLVPYIHICLYYCLVLCCYCNLLFHALLATRHIVQFTMFYSISLQSAHKIKSKESVTILDIEIDNRPNIEKHVSTICKKANNQLNAIRRIGADLGQKEIWIWINFFIYSNFNYSPPIRYFTIRKGTKKVSSL